MQKRLPSKVTPLWIVSAFLTVTEIFVIYAITRVTGGIQVALVVFAMVYALLVFGAFFATLWQRPWVFYAPSEYGNIDPRHFMTSLRDAAPKVAAHVELVRAVEKHPEDLETRFQLIDSMADELHKQYIILMREQDKKIPDDSHVYAFENEFGEGFGKFQMWQFTNQLAGTGLIQIGDDVQWVALTEEGKQFADWLVKRKGKVKYFETAHGGWGTGRSGNSLEKVQMLLDKERPRAIQKLAERAE